MGRGRQGTRGGAEKERETRSHSRRGTRGREDEPAVEADPQFTMLVDPYWENSIKRAEREKVKREARRKTGPSKRKKPNEAESKIEADQKMHASPIKKEKRSKKTAFGEDQEEEEEEEEEWEPTASREEEEEEEDLQIEVQPLDPEDLDSVVTVTGKRKRSEGYFVEVEEEEEGDLKPTAKKGQEEEEWRPTPEKTDEEEFEWNPTVQQEDEDEWAPSAAKKTRRSTIRGAIEYQDTASDDGKPADNEKDVATATQTTSTGIETGSHIST
jgi:hypothetical protein